MTKLDLLERTDETARHDSGPANPQKALKRPQGTAAKRRRLAIDAYGFRVGSLKHKAALMYSSTTGATVNEVKAKLGSTQLNLLKSLEAKGFTVNRQKVKGKKGERMQTRYFLLAV